MPVLLPERTSCLRSSPLNKKNAPAPAPAPSPAPAPAPAPALTHVIAHLDKCVYPSLPTIVVHWVPLPLPGPPAKIIYDDKYCIIKVSNCEFQQFL